MTTVSFHYWAGARAAAGTETEVFEVPSIGAALRACQESRDARFSRVLSVCSLLVDGVVVSAAQVEAPLPGPVTVEILPPFAGG